MHCSVNLIQSGSAEVQNEQRRTALYIISNDVVCGYHEKELTTLQMAPLLCKLLGLKPTKRMKGLEVAFNE